MPWHVQAGLVFFSGYWLMVLGLVVAGRPDLALVALLLKVLGHYVQARATARRAGLAAPPWWLLPLFEGYSLALTTHLTYARLFGRRGVEWKGRHYH